MNKDNLTQLCHTISKETGLTFNSVMTYYFLENILKKLSISRYKDNFIFKGGFILSNIVGLQSRSTVDIDMLMNNIEFSQKRLLEIFEEVLKNEKQSVQSFEILSIDSIKEIDEYGGFRIKVLCRFENIRQIVPIDIATGDVITPHPIIYSFASIFEDSNILIKAYPIETMIAEKIHTIYEKGFLNSRSKDFYDLHILYTLKKDTIEVGILQSACIRTFDYRKTVYEPQKIIEFLNTIKRDDIFSTRWESYVSKNDYVKENQFHRIIDSAINLLKLISN